MKLHISDTASGRLELVAAAVLWGLAGVCVKSITWNPMPQICVRSLLSLLVLLTAKRSLKVRFSFKNVLGGCMISVTGMLYVQAIKLTTAGTAIVLQYVAPIIVFLYAVVFRHRKVKASEIVITLAVFGGIVLSFADSLDPSHVLGNLLGLASGFTFAAQVIIMSTGGNDSDDTLVIGCVLSFLFSFPFCIGDPSISFTAENLIWLAILGIFQYGCANLLFGRGIKKIDSVEASLLLTIEPIFNPIPVAVFCGEKMGPLAVAGFAAVVVFVTLYACLPWLRTRFPGSRFL